MATKVFGNVRANYALTILAAAGAVAGLSACSSNEKTYRPQPRYSNQSSQPVYTPPASNTNPPPAPVTQPPKPAGGSGCGGGGKCG